MGSRDESSHGAVFSIQDDDRVSLFDRSTWSGARLGGAITADEDKSETFVAQARTLLDGLQVLDAVGR